MPVMETQRVCPLVTDGIKTMRRHVQHVWTVHATRTSIPLMGALSGVEAFRHSFYRDAFP